MVPFFISKQIDNNNTTQQKTIIFKNNSTFITQIINLELQYILPCDVRVFVVYSRTNGDRIKVSFHTVGVVLFLGMIPKL